MLTYYRQFLLFYYCVLLYLLFVFPFTLASICYWELIYYSKKTFIIITILHFCRMCMLLLLLEIVMLMHAISLQPVHKCMLLELHALSFFPIYPITCFSYSTAAGATDINDFVAAFSNGGDCVEILGPVSFSPTF